MKKQAYISLLTAIFLVLLLYPQVVKSFHHHENRRAGVLSREGALKNAFSIYCNICEFDFYTNKLPDIPVFDFNAKPDFVLRNVLNKNSIYRVTVPLTIDLRAPPKPAGTSEYNHCSFIHFH